MWNRRRSARTSFSDAAKCSALLLQSSVTLLGTSAWLVLYLSSSIASGAEPSHVASGKEIEPSAKQNALRVSALLQVAAKYREQGQWENALAQLQAAYALQPDPSLLLDQARIHEQMADAHSSQAMDLRSRHHRMLAASPHRVVTTDESKAFRAAGWALFSGFYASAFASGIYFGTTFAQHQKWNDASRGSGRTYYPYEAPASGWSLLVPVMGPLLSVALLPTRTGLDRAWPTYAEKYNWNSASLGSWGLPWMMVDFPGQVAGLVLIILSHRAKGKVRVPTPLAKLRVHSLPESNTHGLQVSGSF